MRKVSPGELSRIAYERRSIERRRGNLPPKQKKSVVKDRFDKSSNNANSSDEFEEMTRYIDMPSQNKIKQTKKTK
jgi:hypothetical protein